jgi:hypothetical protein
MKLHIGRRAFPVADFAEASRLYDEARQASGLGASQFMDGTIKEGRKTVARVSYNAKVWSVAAWVPGMVPLYNPYPAG